MKRNRIKNTINKILILSFTTIAVSVLSFSQANALYTYRDNNISVVFHTFEASEYRVRFFTGFNGSEWNAYTDVNIESGETITIGNVPSPSLAGYTFQGWVTEAPSNENYNNYVSSSTVGNTTVTEELTYYPVLKSNDKKVYTMVNSVGTYYSLNTDVNINYSSIGSTSLGYKYLGIDNGLPGGSVKFDNYNLITASGKYQFVESGDNLLINRKIGLKISDTNNDYWFQKSTEKYTLYYFKKNGDVTESDGWTNIVTRNDSSNPFSCNFYIQAWYPQIIFVRLDNTAESPAWNKKWNQSGDITLNGNYTATNYINSKNTDWWDTWTGTWVSS